MEIGKTFCGCTDGRTYGRTDGRTHLSSNLLGHRRGDDRKINAIKNLTQVQSTRLRKATPCAKTCHTIVKIGPAVFDSLTAHLLTPKILKLRLHDACNLLSNRLLNRFDSRLDNRLYRVYKHPAGCQTGLTTGWMFVYTMQPVVQAVV